MDEFPGWHEFDLTSHRDLRGSFTELFRDVSPQLLKLPRISQMSYSVSRRGVLRGIHYAQVPPGQAKLVTCPYGRIFDVAVNLMEGSPLFGESWATELDGSQVVWIGEGMGHAFMSLRDDSVMLYATSTVQDQSREHAISPLDPDLDIDWPYRIRPVMSRRDASAMSLKQAAEDGLLPLWRDCPWSPGTC